MFQSLSINRNATGIDLKYLNRSSVETSIFSDEDPNNSELKSILQNSDLVAGKYEGGLKLWEGAADLCRYLVENWENENETLVQNGSQVMEIGCGAGLPGILCLKLGAQSVCFQDFNRETLVHFTKPNLLANFPESQDITNSCTFEHGDWSEINNYSTPVLYDLILTSETIYNTDSYERLHSLLNRSLTAAGRVLVAAKGTYFGLSGCAHDWLDYVNSQSAFSIQIVKEIDTSVPRLIMLMRRV